MFKRIVKIKTLLGGIIVYINNSMAKKITDRVKLAVLTEGDFDKFLSPITTQIISASSSACKDVISHIKKVIKSKSFPPQQKLRALIILNSCMQTSNANFLQNVQEKILTRLSILASYKKEVPIPIRAEGIFGHSFSNNPVFKESSIEFINLLLSYLKSWAADFGMCPDKSDSLFFTVFKKLKDSGVVFPKSGKKDEKVENKKKLEILITVENILELLEKCEDSELAEDYKNMVKSHVRGLQDALKNAVDGGNQDEAEDISMLLARIDSFQGIISGSGNRGNDFSHPIRSSSDFVHYQVSGAYSIPENWSQRTSSNFEYDNEYNHSENPSRRHSAFTAPIRSEPLKKIVINESDSSILESVKNENSELLKIVELNKTQLTEKNSQIWSLEKKVAELIEENQKLKKIVDELKNKEKNYSNFGLNMESSLKLKEEPKLELIKEPEGQNEIILDLDLNYKRKSEFQTGKTESKELDLNFTFKQKNEPNGPIIPFPSPKAQKPLINSPRPAKKLKSSPSNLLFSEESSEEDSPLATQIPVPELSIPYRICNCSDSGLLFENSLIQIGFQSKLKPPDILCILLIGNKSPTPITEVTTELFNISMDSFPIIMQPIKTTETLNQHNHTSRMLKGQLVSPISKIPSLKITFKSDSVYTLTINLPITLARFCVGQKENPGQIWPEWKKMAFEEKSFEVQLGEFNNLIELCGFLTFGTAFALYSKQEIQELGVCEVLGVGRYEGVLIMFAINVSSSGKDAKVRIRCRNNDLTEVLFPIIASQISNKFII